eukprot:scaffold2576_cov116-Cylindrotheca_fusiformis.AAC.1
MFEVMHAEEKRREREGLYPSIARASVMNLSYHDPIQAALFKDGDSVRRDNDLDNGHPRVFSASSSTENRTNDACLEQRQQHPMIDQSELALLEDGLNEMFEAMHAEEKRREREGLYPSVARASVMNLSYHHPFQAALSKDGYSARQDGGSLFVL